MGVPSGAPATQAGFRAPFPWHFVNATEAVAPEPARRPRAAGNGAYQPATAWFTRAERDERDLATLARMAVEALNRYT